MVKFNYEQNKYICTMVWPDSQYLHTLSYLVNKHLQAES